MLKKIIKFLKRILFSFLIIYGYNIIISPVNMIIPLNIITVGYVTIFGIPGFISIILIFFLIY